MNTRFQGFGRALIAVPVLSYIPLRFVIGDLEDTHHALVAGISLIVSAIITLVIASVLDGRTGLNIWTKPAWTSRLLESQHIFFYVPVRLAGAVALLAGIVLLFV